MNKNINNDTEPVVLDDKPNVTDEQLSGEEIDLLRQSIEAQKIDRSRLPHYDNSGKAQAIRYAKKNLLLMSIIAVCAICMVIISILGIVFAVRYAKSKPNTDDFVIYVGEETYIEEYDFAMRSDSLYIDMRKVAAEGGMIISGTKSTASFSTSKGQYISFEDGSEMAIVNGNKVELGGIAEVNESVCMIPYKFLTSILESDTGIRVSYNSIDNTIEIKRRYTTVDGEKIFIDISFDVTEFEVITEPVDPDSLYQYNIDISKYLDSIKSENLLLVNKQEENYLGRNYLPDDLVKLNCRTRDIKREWEFMLRADAANALYAMMLEMDEAGFTDIKVTSAYRPYSYQEELFEGYVAEYKRDYGMSQAEAEAEASRTSARPGASEHQSGLCVDFVTDQYPRLTEEFEKSDEFKWLAKNAHKFGFILRYPKGSEDVTGYSYEPWHYRFVGRDAATEIYESGLAFEEYLQSKEN